MIGEKIVDFLEAHVVMQKLSGNELRFDKSFSFEMEVTVAEIVSFELFVIFIECLFHYDNTGGQIRFHALDMKEKTLIDQTLDSYEIRKFIGNSSITAYVDDEKNEDDILKLLVCLCGADKVAI